MGNSLPKLTLVLGGAGSGKSAFAEALVLKDRKSATYIATAQAFDDEMREKISQHQARRGDEWFTVEAPLDLAGAVAGLSVQRPALLDCVTLWLSNQLLAEAEIESEEARLLKAIEACAVPLTVVSNEVGYGIVPDNALARRFRQRQGWLNQALAARADTVVMVVAGLPQVLKGVLPDG